ncbi:sigma factor-like helix-turn-helix DNA-binding protein [Paenibacillus sp. FSL R10-2778]|uniref:sigma factor-like helix-turn-helix DNA-binding protein n=1 Tax=Paenibacillus sp. FSL R10-2778 TaxID=2954659 RepID=UPI003159543F
MNIANSKAPVVKVTDLGPATALNYQLSLKGAERAYRKADADDKKVISGMKSDCEFVIEWLNTGRRPGNKRGIERRAGYEREILLDPIRMQAFASNSKAGSPANLTDDPRFQIQYALDQLSERERECYTLAHGECISHSEIARMLGLADGTVSEYVQRAQRKVSEVASNSLFFI